MSLSKYFKNSDSFHPEHIVKTQNKAGSGWKSLVKKHQSDPFQAEQQIKKDERSTGMVRKDPDSIHSPEDPSLFSSPSSSGTTRKHESEKLNAPSQLPDADQYIEASEVEKQIKNAYENGIQKGYEKAEEDYGSAARSFAASCRQLDTVRETIIGNSSRELQEFAFAIAERIIRTSLQDSDSTIIATIDEALQRAVKSDEFYIYIHPDDYDTVMEKSNDLITGLSGLSNIVIKKDITVEKGGAKIESDNCTIDATIAGQFDVILEEMEKRL